jgi:CHAD domain-containing protein
MKETREREVKLAAPVGFTVPDLGGVVDGAEISPGPVRELDAVYYDTPDLRLTRWGLSLRHRSGEGWTVKLPAGDRGALLTRAEVTFDGPPGAVPPAAAALVRAYVRSASLEPVARLKTCRRPVEVRDPSGTRLAEIVVDDVSVYQGDHLVGSFRELEVELADAAPRRLLDALVDALRKAGAGSPSRTPKIVRALGARAAAPPDVVVPEVGPKASTAEVVRAAIAGAAMRIITNDPWVRLGEDPEAVHQARVGTRRLRSDLRTFGPLLEESWVAALRTEAGWLGGLLGAVRDADVLSERLQRQAAHLPDGDAARLGSLFARLAGERDAARDSLLVGLDSSRYVEFLDRLVEATAGPAVVRHASRRATKLLPDLVRKPWRRLRRAVDELPAEPSDTGLHQVRIRAKRCRYAAEAAEPVIGKPAAAFAEALAALQTVLGDHQDAVVAEAWLRGHLQGLSADEALVVGELVAAQRAAKAAARAAWPEVWRVASRRKLRSWLG